MPVRSNCKVPLASDAVTCSPVPTVTVEGSQRVSMVMLFAPETEWSRNIDLLKGVPLKLQFLGIPKQFPSTALG